MANHSVSSSVRARLGKRRPHAVAAILAALSSLCLAGCAGVVSGSNAVGTPPPPSALDITNVQAATTTTSTSNIIWTTNALADSSVDYGTTAAYGTTTPVDSTMVTNHQLTLSGLAAGTTYYYQVNSTDSKSNHGKSGGHSFKTPGFAISGAINPAAGGNGATLTLAGAGSATTTPDSSGNYAFTGLANGSYTVVPSHAGFAFTPSSKSAPVNGADVTAMNFPDHAEKVSISATISP